MIHVPPYASLRDQILKATESSSNVLLPGPDAAEKARPVAEVRAASQGRAKTTAQARLVTEGDARGENGNAVVSHLPFQSFEIRREKIGFLHESVQHDFRKSIIPKY